MTFLVYGKMNAQIQILTRPVVGIAVNNIDV